MIQYHDNQTFPKCDSSNQYVTSCRTNLRGNEYKVFLFAWNPGRLKILCGDRDQLSRFVQIKIWGTAGVLHRNAEGCIGMRRMHVDCIRKTAVCELCAECMGVAISSHDEYG